jgi:hypothetical protein
MTEPNNQQEYVQLHLGMTEPNSQQEYLQVQLGANTAAVLADIQSLKLDIHYARWCAETFLKWKVDRRAFVGNAWEGNEQLLGRALWGACCISYRRAFSAGRGHIQPQAPRPILKKELIDALSPDQVGAHKTVLRMANQHIAHRSGDDLEMVRVIALLNPPPLPRAVVDVKTLVIHFAGPDREFVKRFITVCDVLVAKIGEAHDLVTKGVLGFLQQQDVDQIYAILDEPEENRG